MNTQGGPLINKPIINNMEALIFKLRRIEAPDEAFRIWCPNCGFVLAEGVLGAVRFLCRNCRWEGVVHRNEFSLVQSYSTLREGRDTAFISNRAQTKM